MSRTKLSTEITDRLRHAEKACLVAGALGGLLIALGLLFVWNTGWGIELFVPGAALVTVALSAYVASGGVISWREQRQRDREASEYRHREEVYEELAAYMIARFLGQPTDMVKDGALRSSAALWGSEEVVEALKGWQSTLHTILENHGMGGGGVVSMTPDEQIAIKHALAKTLTAMRNDLGSTSGQVSLDPEVLLGSIFNA